MGAPSTAGEAPRSLVLNLALTAIVAGLALAPFLFPGSQSLNVAAKICYFIVLVASYDLLLGYTGIVIGLPLSMLLALAIGLFSLRVAAIFFAMITLAVASAFQVLASQLSWLTGGEDGRTFRVPELLRPGFRLFDTEVFGLAITGRIVTYYLVFAVAVLLFLAMLRVVNSPFGRVLQAIRENDFRAEAIGYRTVVYRSIINCVSAAMATLAGVLCALWLRYTGPGTTLSFDIMLDILLMVVIGGMGTMYGAVIGATLFIVAQNYLQKLMGTASKATEGIPLLSSLLHPDRWLLVLGILFVLSVYFFPTGVVGRLRAGKAPAR